MADSKKRQRPVESSTPDGLEARLAAALAERDEALKQLAIERARNDALRFESRTTEEAAPEPYPASAGLGPPPLRYRVVDKLNDGLKQLGPAQTLARDLLDRLIKGGEK